MSESDSKVNPFEKYLEEGEQILWRGTPEREAFRNRHKARYVTMAFGGFACCTAAAFFLLQFSDMPVYGVIIIFVLSAAGLAVLTLGQPFVLNEVAGKLHFAVTDRRILHLYSDNLTSKKISELPDVSLKCCEGGIGDITFGGLSAGSDPERLEFACVRDAQKAYDHIVQAREGKAGDGQERGGANPE